MDSYFACNLLLDHIAQLQVLFRSTPFDINARKTDLLKWQDNTKSSSEYCSSVKRKSKTASKSKNIALWHKGWHFKKSYQKMFNFENWFLCQFSSNTWFFFGRGSLNKKWEAKFWYPCWHSFHSSYFIVHWHSFPRYGHNETAHILIGRPLLFSTFFMVLFFKHKKIFGPF